jgi:hypothetical protein
MIRCVYNPTLYLRPIGHKPEYLVFEGVKVVYYGKISFYKRFFVQIWFLAVNLGVDKQGGDE